VGGLNEARASCKLYTNELMQYTQLQNTVDYHLGQSGSTCGLKEFECSNGECILGLKECDGHNDCVDGTDEYPQCGQCQFFLF